MTYKEFLETKIELATESGFIVDPEKVNKALKPHQRDAVMWALKGGRRALFESFGLGKTVQEIEFCHLAAEHSGGRAQMHVCPLQLDIVERIINRYSNEGDTVYDPFGGLMTVPMTAVKMHRYGKGCELNPDYFRDCVGYLQAAENEVDEPTLFDFMEV